MKMKKKASIGSAALALFLASTGVSAFVDGIAVEGGTGDDGVDMVRVAVQWDWKKPLYQGRNWHLGAHLDLGLGYWTDNAAPGRNDDLFEIGLTPVFRVQRDAGVFRGIYGEAAVGAHLLSHTSIGDRRMSTAFQFGSHAGVGYRFGTKDAFDVSYRFQHFSNASIKRLNQGINFNQIRLQYHFR